MSKFFLRFFLLLLITTILSIIYVSYFGIKTDQFDELIKDKANSVNQYIKLEFKATKIHLKPNELKLIIKLQNPKVLIINNEINLSKLDLFLPLKSFFSSDFLLERAEVAFIKNDIKDLTKITNIFLPRIINKQFNKVFEKGNLEGEFVIPFESDGSIGKDYGFSGKISDASINLNKEFSIKNLTTEIQNNKKGEFKATIKKGLLFDLDLSGSTINLINKENAKKIKTSLNTNGKINFSQIKKISSLFRLKNNTFKNISGTANLETNIDFDIDTKFRIKNLSYSISGKVDYLELHAVDKTIINNYLPLYDSKITLKNTTIDFKPYEEVGQKLTLNGEINLGEGFDTVVINHIYNKKTKKNKITGTLNLLKSEITIPRLNFKKNKDKVAILAFNIDFILNKYFFINILNYEEGEHAAIQLNNIELNNRLEFKGFNNMPSKNVIIKTYSNPDQPEISNNDFSIDFSDKIVVSGKLFDAQPLLKSLYKKIDRKTFDKKFKGELKISFDKAVTGTRDNISNFTMIASVNKGSYVKLSSKGNFSKNEIFEMSIYQADKDKKTLQVISDRARPFIKNFDFIKGFEGGKLEYMSTISKEGSNSNLAITDFKVSKVPALAQLLTLASLQGIADTLSGEGIRFDSFEMKSNSTGNVLNIEDALALGPAVSILLEGYVDKGKIVSLRGTLIPATKLNSIIASIPVVGDILVGTKTGEGVIGVSFKMKGPPKDIKTTVNPIKSLTPRFIVRAVEKMKKKKEQTK